MRRRSANEKIDLLKVLEMIGNDPGIRYGDCVAWFKGWLHCSKSAVNDTLTVLSDAGCLIVETDPADRRLRRYRISEQGQLILASPYGSALLLHARFLFTKLAGRPAAARDLPALQTAFDEAV